MGHTAQSRAWPTAEWWVSRPDSEASSNVLPSDVSVPVVDVLDKEVHLEVVRVIGNVEPLEQEAGSADVEVGKTLVTPRHGEANG